MKSYYLLALFAIVPFLTIDAYSQMDTMSDTSMAVATVSDGAIFPYAAVSEAIELSKEAQIPLGPLKHADDGSPFHDVEVVPKCTDSLYQLSRTVSANMDGSITIEYKVPSQADVNKLDRPILVFIHSNPQFANILTLNPELNTGDNSVYSVTIDAHTVKSIFSFDPTHRDHIELFLYFYAPSNTVSKDFIFSTTSDGTDLYYYENAIQGDVPLFIQLPAGHDAESFVEGTNPGIAGQVYLPTSDITFDDPILCRYATFDPMIISELIDFEPTRVTSTSNGLELSFNLNDDRKPDQISWFLTDSDGTTTDGVASFASDRNAFTIPVTESGLYDVVMYGTLSNQFTMFGPYATSLDYSFSNDMTCVQCTPEEARMIAEANLLRDLPLSVSVDKAVYDHDSKIVVSGQVSNVEFGAPVIVTVYNPLNSIVTIDQIGVAGDKSFQTVLNTAGSLWKYDGLYIIKVSYGSAQNSIRVTLTDGEPLPGAQPIVTPEPRECSANELDASGECIPYTITGGTVTSAMIDVDTKSIMININAQDDGVLVISPSTEVQTGIFMVLVDGEESDDAVIDGNNVTVMFDAGAEKIEVFGTWVIPEFGAIAMLILAVAIVSMIVVSTRSRLGIIPRS